jgi:hypothetical protein
LDAFLLSLIILAQPLRGSGETRPDSAPPPLEYRNPTGALLRSSVLPGWGQFYNDKPVKGIIMGLAETSLLAWLIAEHAAAEGARDDYSESGDPADLERYETHRQTRLDLIWYTSAAWLYGMLDAYVDAHLYCFEQENERFEKDLGIGALVFVRF